METVLIVIHLMVVLVLVGVILLQKSEGGGLDVGGNSGFMTARSTANTLTRATAILATIFFITSLGLSLLARYGEKPMDILDRAPVSGQTGGNGVLDQLPGSSTPQQPAENSAAPAVPTSSEGSVTAPAATAPTTAPANEPAAGAATPDSAAPAAPQVPNQ